MSGKPTLRRFTDGRVPDPGIADLFTRASRLRARLRVEAALAQSEADAEVIPHRAGAAITAAADIDNLDLDRMNEAARVDSHPLMPLIDELSRAVGDEYGGWVHWGATTQNITQTADLLLIKQAHHRLLDLLADLLREFSKLADDTAAVPMPGRTHSQHAVPITFGFKVAMWIDAIASHVDRLQRLEDRLFRLLMGGATGTMASFGVQGRAIEAGVAERLGLGTMPVPSRATNDGMVEFVTVLGLLAGTAGKIAKDIYSMTQPEFGEVAEPIPPGTIGSSTMPHKRNPQLTLDIMNLSAQVRALVAPALESMLHDHEANGGMTDLLDDTVSRATMLTGDYVARLLVIAKGLELDTARMRKNLDLSFGMIGSESLMLQLGEVIGRQEAHELVYKLAQRAATDGTEGADFVRLIKTDPVISGQLTPEEIDAALDPRTHLGESAAIARTMAEHARAVADHIQLTDDN